MTPLADMPSSLVEESRGSLEWSSIQRPAVVLHKIEEKEQKNMGAQRTSRGAKKYGGLCYIEYGRGCIL